MRKTRTTMRWLAALALFCAFAAAHAQKLEVLDRVVAVVNNQAILNSDIENEMRLSVLDPERGPQRTPSARGALQRLISRALIQQQIGQNNLQTPEPQDAEIDVRLKQLREQLPACVEARCATDPGWTAFLKQNALTNAEVRNYLRLRIELLSFIELRFRQGIQIPREEVEKYYKETLLPQYPTTEKPPPLDAVAQRIEEILLQQKVNVLFGTWLADLRKQGNVEVLDPALELSANEDSSEENQ